MSGHIAEVEKSVFMYDLALKGLWGRNRKIKFEVFKLATTEAKLSPEDVRKLAQEAITAHKVKPGASYKVTETPATRTTYTRADGSTYSTVSFMLFSGATVEAGSL